MDRKFIISGIQLQDGVESMSRIVSMALFKVGAYVARDPDYLSTIYGGKAGTAYYQVRVSDREIWCPGDETADVLIALELSRKKGELPVAAKNYLEKISRGGLLIYDSSFAGALEPTGCRALPVPAYEIAKKLFPGEAEGKIGKIRNSVLVGALFELYGFDPANRLSRAVFEEQFVRKGGVAEQNLTALSAGRAFVTAHPDFGRPEPLVFGKPENKRVFLTGNDALCLGAFSSGVGLYTGYPITPASPILELMEKNVLDFNGACLQSEDEIAAAMAVFGASYGGAVAFTATSGPGFSLMIETIGQAGMAEIPLVIVDVQRAGASTGMPTKTEQSDLHIAIFGHHGEIPKIVLAPGDVTECFEIMPQAFYLAAKYRLPVIVLSSLDLGEGWATAPEFDLDYADQFNTFRAAARSGDDALHKSYELTASGVSPAALPGKTGCTVRATGVEHDEWGFVSTNQALRIAMVKKRLRKMEAFLREDFRAPLVSGREDSDITLIGWGSTKGAIREAAERLSVQGMSVRRIHFSYLWPLSPETVRNVVPSGKKIFVVEGNETGEFAMLLRLKAAEAGMALTDDVLIRVPRCDGRPHEPQKIVNRVLAEVGRG